MYRRIYRPGIAQMIEHLYRFSYDIDREQLVKEHDLMSSSDETSLHNVNTELLEKVNAGRDTGEDIFLHTMI